MAAEKLCRVQIDPDIFLYHDYRKFLKDRFAYLRGLNSENSVRAFARAAGMSESYLSMVISGQRKLSSELLTKLCPHLGLDASSQSYLVWLHSIAEGETEESRLMALKKIQRFYKYKEQNFSEVETYAYLVNWYYIVIREMAVLPDFQFDPKWIQTRLKFKIKSKQAQEALEFLTQHGFIEKDSDGKYKSPEKKVHAKPGVLRPAMIKFHREMLSRACDSIETTPSELRNISSHTASLSVEQVAEVKKIMDEAKAKIIALTENESKGACEVYHFGFLAFPMTKLSGSK